MPLLLPIAWHDLFLFTALILRAYICDPTGWKFMQDNNVYLQWLIRCPPHLWFTMWALDRARSAILPHGMGTAQTGTPTPQCATYRSCINIMVAILKCPAFLREIDMPLPKPYDAYIKLDTSPCTVCWVLWTNLQLDLCSPEHFQLSRFGTHPFIHLLQSIRLPHRLQQCIESVTFMVCVPFHENVERQGNKKFNRISIMQFLPHLAPLVVPYLGSISGV